LGRLLDCIVRYRRFSKRLKPRPRVDRSTKRPLRYPKIGLLLRLIGGVSCVAVVYCLYDSGALMMWAEIPFVLVIYIGYRLSLPPATLMLKKDPRDLVLYLRSFADDGQSSFNPEGFTANFLGITSPRLGGFGFLLNVNPARVIRMIFKGPLDNAEEQMASYFQKIGPFVAIGKPGESLTRGGAARVHVDDDSWRATVLDLMGRAGIVVLQPSESEGVWWEVHQVLERIAPKRLLLSLVNFRNDQARYTLFRTRFEAATGRLLPRRLGDGVFCRFDEGWSPRILPIRYTTPFLWPLAGCSTDFKTTLAPFDARLHGISQGPLRPDESQNLGFQKAAAIVAWPLIFAVFTYLVLMVSSHFQE
jgi:hypothetical protein